MREFSNSFARPFNVRYNPYTQSIEVPLMLALQSLLILLSLATQLTPTV
jgi:hypothetical protein